MGLLAFDSPTFALTLIDAILYFLCFVFAFTVYTRFRIALSTQGLPAKTETIFFKLLMFVCFLRTVQFLLAIWFNGQDEAIFCAVNIISFGFFVVTKTVIVYSWAVSIIDAESITLQEPFLLNANYSDAVRKKNIVKWLFVVYVVFLVLSTTGWLIVLGLKPLNFYNRWVSWHYVVVAVVPFIGFVLLGSHLSKQKTLPMQAISRIMAASVTYAISFLIRVVFNFTFELIPSWRHLLDSDRVLTVVLLDIMVEILPSFIVLKLLLDTITQFNPMSSKELPAVLTGERKWSKQ